MPKCKVDSTLQSQVQRFIRDRGLTINGAATNLGINRTTFWRFCDTGKASPKTKLQLRNALEKRNEHAAQSVSFDANEVIPASREPALLEFLADRELKQIRRACEGVLALIDVYEARRSGQKKI